MDEGSPLRVYSDRITKSLNDMIEDVEFDFAMRYGESIYRGRSEKFT